MALALCVRLKPTHLCFALYSIFVGILSIQLKIVAADTNLSVDYYSKSCPTAVKIIREVMECAVLSDPRNAAAILRLHFHDCFVQGCDGSVLLDDTITLKGEKEASQNVNSLIGFDLVDRIKNFLESECPGIVSCADLLTVAARDAVLLFIQFKLLQVGGPYWDVPLGRKDSKTASLTLAEENLPAASEGLLNLAFKFISQGLSVTDMVALIGSHTIGMARCENFRGRIYGDFESTMKNGMLSEAYLEKLKSVCPVHGGEDNITAMDHLTPNLFDNSFYQQLLRGEGVLNSDQEMYSSFFGFETKGLVVKYAHDSAAFFQQFSDSMVKLGNILNQEGEVRKNCRFINT